MESKEIKYFNFPIQLLNGFIEDTKTSLTNISNYSCYNYSLNLEGNTKADKFKSASKYFGINFNNPSTSLKSGIMLHDSLESNSPKTGINLAIYWDFYNNEKSEFDKVCLLAFLAIKSILQKKSYCKTTNNYFLARMDGKTHSCESIELSTRIKKYANEYQTKKIKNELVDNWGLVTYSRYTRGFYISYSMQLQDLVLQAETRRKSTKEKQRKALQESAFKNALLKLGVK